MPIIRNLTGKQFGGKIKHLFELMETTSDWEKYLDGKTYNIVSALYKNKNMTQTLEELDIKYPTARAHIIRAIDRIENKRLDYLRKGKSYQAQRLFNLMKNPNWKEGLTEHEVLLAESFKEYKNFYAVARELDLLPGNVASTLYGNTQKLGVINKIEKRLKI